MSDLITTLWTAVHQTLLSMGFPKQECWSGLTLLSPGVFPILRLNPRLQYILHWQVDSLSLCHLGSSHIYVFNSFSTWDVPDKNMAALCSPAPFTMWETQPLKWPNQKTLKGFLLKKFYLLLGYSWLTMLWRFQMKSKGTCIHSPPNSPPIQVATWH